MIALRKGETPNETAIDLGVLTIWFSYQTPVAFRVEGEPRVVRVNDWSTTTGKHLNRIDGGAKRSRIPGAEFTRQLQEVIDRVAPCLSATTTPEQPLH